MKLRKNRQLISLLVISQLLIAGCGKPAPAVPRTRIPDPEMLKKVLAINRKKQMEAAEKLARAEIAEFEKDMGMLRARNPFAAIPTEKVVTETPQLDLKLGGIIWNDVSPSAMINDDIVEVGDTVGDATVKKIMKTSVILMKGNEEYTLEMQF